MATYTENLNLKKPDLTDPASIGDINNNMDILDEEVGALHTEVSQMRDGGLIIEEISNNVGDVASGDTFSGQLDIFKAGYRPIGVVGYACNGSGSSYANLFACYISGNTLYYRVRNARSGVMTLTLITNILYHKED